MALTSDVQIFHRIIQSFGAAIAGYAQQAGKPVHLSAASSVLLVIHQDETAELWVDTVAVSLTVLTKRAIQAGTAVFESDIADVTEMRFPLVEIGPTDRILYLFREDWRFGLFFDFNPDGKLSLDEVARALGTLYRQLKYRHLYDVLADEAAFGRLIKAGWFPFVEIIGGDFKGLADACEAGFELDDAEAQLLKRFGHERLDRMFARWIAKPHFQSKERILLSAVNAYKAQDSVAVLKIVLTEIEGILADAYRASTGKGAKLKELLKFAAELAERKVGAPDTLLFSAAFTQYLDAYTFANFDPTTRTGAAGSRHAVGHGAADGSSYTQVRALQALLTLDQIAFYT